MYTTITFWAFILSSLLTALGAIWLTYPLFTMTIIEIQRELRMKPHEMLDPVPEWFVAQPGERVTHALAIAPDTFILHCEYTDGIHIDPRSGEDIGCFLEIAHFDMRSQQVVYFQPSRMHTDDERYLYMCIRFAFSRLVHGDEDPDFHIDFGTVPQYGSEFTYDA
jgi:hypothetical protein